MLHWMPYWKVLILGGSMEALFLGAKRWMNILAENYQSFARQHRIDLKTYACRSGPTLKAKSLERIYIAEYC